MESKIKDSPFNRTSLVSILFFCYSIKRKKSDLVEFTAKRRFLEDHHFALTLLFFCYSIKRKKSDLVEFIAKRRFLVDHHLALVWHRLCSWIANRLNTGISTAISKTAFFVNVQ
ncbi:hypothetical protein BpHYR1_030346 [Brachionus plicatilis]|uniref:Uncharacterized protein n=1 Tax=Brachionus plicatilis TaxID=10195 RepID=A0A3M7RBN1_BRAPC|nr:hypothetical protein BpHYR1_030346 [Brachionus plicatilis]